MPVPSQLTGSANYDSDDDALTITLNRPPASEMVSSYNQRQRFVGEPSSTSWSYNNVNPEITQTQVIIVIRNFMDAFTGFDGTWHYCIRARNTDGFGEFLCFSITIGTPAASLPTTPSAPTITVKAFATSALITLSEVNTNPAVDDYQIRYTEGSDAGGDWQSTGDISRTYLVEDLEPDTQYTFQGRAVNANGESDASSAVTITTLNVPWELFLDFADESDIDTNRYKGLQVTHNRVFLTRDSNRTGFNLETFDHDGNAQTTEDKAFGVYSSGRIEALAPLGRNSVLAAYSDATEGVGGRVLIVRDFADGHGRYGAFEPRGSSEGNRLKDIKSIALIPDGVLISDGGDSALTNATTDAGIYRMSFDDILNSLISDESDERSAYQTVSLDDGDLDISITRNDLIAAWDDRFYISKEEKIYPYTTDYQRTDTAILLFDFGSNEERRDMTVHGNHLYYLTTHGIYRLDLHKARAPRPKQVIYPQFANEGGSLDLTQFVKGADDIGWATEFTNPSYLSIDSSYQLNIAASAVSEDTTVLLKFVADNGAGETEFEFYLTVIADASPAWEDIDAVPMTTADTLDLFRLVKNANSITWRSGFTQPSDTDLTDGKFSFTDTPSASRIEVQFTATNTHGSTHITFDIDIVKASRQIAFSDTTRYRVEIEGIDITDDLIVGEGADGMRRQSVFSVQENLDVLTPNVVTIGNCLITLNNSDEKYNTYTEDNFWDDNSLNPGGFRAEIKLYIDSLIDGSYVEDLLFSGVISQSRENISNASIELTCVDTSYLLRNASLNNIGLEKQAHLFRGDEDSYEGIYSPETSMVPILQESAEAIAGSTELRIKTTANASEGVIEDNSAYVSDSDLRTQGGYLDDRPLLKYRMQHRRRNMRFVIDALSRAVNLYNASVNIDIPELTADAMTSYGNIGFNVANTRITRLPVDWVRDATNNCLFILLSNPEAHVADQLVRYDIDDDRYRLLYDFPLGVRTHRLASSDFDTFYILATTGDSIDGSRVPRPRVTEDIASQYDATLTDNAHIRRYVVSTDTETDDFVESTDSRSPQVGLHYFAGFTNKHTLHAFESLLPDDRSAFDIYDSQLYYRYATPTAFGVARVNTSGTTAALFSETPDDYWNTTNFAFDLASNGDVYFGYVSGGEFNEDSTLTLKRRTAAGVTTTILTDSKALHELTELQEIGGTYSGVHELRFYDDDVYLVAEIQRVRFPIDIDFETEFVAYGLSGTPNTIQLSPFDLDIDDTTREEQTLSFNLPTGIGANRLSIDGNDIYKQSGDTIRVIPKDTPPGETATATRTMTLPAGNGNCVGIAIDGDDIYSLDGVDKRIYIFPKDTSDGQQATTSRTINFPTTGFTNLRTMAIDGDDVYCFNANQISVLPKDTPDGQTATISRTINSPVSPVGFDIRDDNIYAVTNAGVMYVFSKDTADGE